MARTRNPAISPILILGLGAAAYFVLRGGSDGGGGGGGEGLKGAFDARTFSGAGELFVDGAKAGDIGPVPVTFTLAAGVPLTLKVKFADGSESPERRIVLQPSGPASVGGFNPQQLFTSSAVSEQSWAKLQADLTAQNQTEKVSAVQAIADAIRLTKARRYEEAIAAYRAIDQNYPGTLQATIARVTAAQMTTQLMTTAGRAALDRSNSIG